MANKKTHYYVLVFTAEGAKYVTKINNADRTAEWNKDEKPLEMTKERANELMIGLTWNCHSAQVVASPVELDNQPYRYNDGHFEWVKN